MFTFFRRPTLCAITQNRATSPPLPRPLPFAPLSPTYPPHKVYRIEVMTPNQQWFVFRRYSEFHALHQKLVKQCGLKKDLLPSKRLTGERGTPTSLA